MLTTIGCGPRGEVAYALEGAVFNGGSTVQWLRDELKLINDALDTEYFAGKVKDSNGVYRCRRSRVWAHLIGTPTHEAHCSV